MVLPANAGLLRNVWCTSSGSEARPINDTPTNALNKPKKHLGRRPAFRSSTTPGANVSGSIRLSPGAAGLSYRNGTDSFSMVGRSKQNDNEAFYFDAGSPAAARRFSRRVSASSLNRANAS